MSKVHTKEEQKKLLLNTLQENSNKILPLVKDTITKILRYRGSRWIDMVDSETKDKTLLVLEVTKKIKPEIKSFIDKIIDRLDQEYFIYDENGKWEFINKLNTNRSDFCVLICDLIERSKYFNMSEIDMDIKKSNFIIFRQFLLEIEKHPEFIWDKFLFDKDRYTTNIRKNSEEGEIAEKHVIDHYINNGWEIFHVGGNGDLIDMLLGTDLIVKKNNEYLYVQIKKIPSIGKIDIDNEVYVEIKGDFNVTNRTVIDVIAYATLDGDVFTSKRQNFYYYRDKNLKKDFGLPIPSTTYNKRILVKN